MKRKLTATLLLISLLASVSCGSGVDVQNETSSDSSSAEATTATETKQIEPTLPDVKYEGYEFRVLTKGDTNVHWKSKDIQADEETGDVINDAVYRRNLAVGERFGVKIVDIASPNGTWNLTDTLRASVMAGSDDYDMAASGFTDCPVKMAAEGGLVDLNTIPYMDLSKPWYDQNSIEQLQINGKNFAVTGDMLIMDDDATLAVLFNKQLAEDYKLGDLYQLVKNGKWTIDLMTKYAADAAADLNNNGTMDYEDQYGLTSEELNTYASIIGCGVQGVIRNKDGEFEFNVQNERFIDALSKSLKLNRNYDFTIHSAKVTGVNEAYADVIDPAFVAGRILFNYAGLVRVSHFRAMETDFGIIPQPKYDEAQEKYYSMVSIACANCITVPASATNLERTGAIIEALSAEGYYNIKDAYYDNVLKTKGARDEESSEMLDIIFENRVFDIGYMYDWGGLLSSLYQLEIDGNIASTIDSKLQAAKTAMQKTIDDYNALD